MNTALDKHLLPIAVGRYLDPNGKHFLPFTLGEVERGRNAMLRMLRTFHFRSGENVLFCSLLDEAAFVVPLERACNDYGLLILSADSSFFDAGRVESIMRRFDVSAVFGVTPATLAGLQALGHDPMKLFAHSKVWAGPGAWEQLEGLPHLRCWREVGPAIALECAAGGGPHICRFEWDVEEDKGEIVLSSRLARALPFRHYHTGVHARLDHTPCACGNADPRLVF
jgi:hypothetical protein